MVLNSDWNLGYLALVTKKEGLSFSAGCLIVDISGLPKEFRLSLPIEINEVQKTLYGESLESEAGKIFGLPLIKEIRNSPHIFFVEDPRWLFLRPSLGAIPIIGICKEMDNQKIPIINSVESFQKGFKLLFHKNFPEDKEVLERVLEEVHFDLTEPFSRIRNAIDLYYKTNHQ